MILRPDAFTAEQKERNFAYYERITVRDSSLSAGSQAVMAAEVGQPDLALDYLRETAQIDLADLEHNAGDGLHLAAIANVWTVLTAGFGGLRMRAGIPHFAPRLPLALTRLSFRIGCGAACWWSGSPAPRPVMRPLTAGLPRSVTTGRC